MWTSLFGPQHFVAFSRFIAFVCSGIFKAERQRLCGDALDEHQWLGPLAAIDETAAAVKEVC